MKTILQMEPRIGKEEIKAVNAYLKSGSWLTEFQKTREFEDLIAKYVGSNYASVVNNGTVSLFIALVALEIGKGDEVLVPDFTMIASANTVILAGAKAVLVDIEETTGCIDLKKAEQAVTKKTKALMYVSLNGRSGNMDDVLRFCKKHKLQFIEDSAQSLGSTWYGKHLGTFGKIGSFSFSSQKIVTTGQGGALVTDDEKLFDRIKKIKDFGRERGGIDKHIALGYNFKFTDLQAVVGIEQMKKLSERVQRKKDIYALYQKELEKCKQVSFIVTDLKDTSPWFIDVFVEKREALIDYLKSKDIGSRAFYPPIHTQVPYNAKNTTKNKTYPVSHMYAERGLWLPSSTFLKNPDIIRICKTIKEFYAKNG
jgi:perosamine synthetase